jgi:hypothetical protein
MIVRFEHPFVHEHDGKLFSSVLLNAITDLTLTKKLKNDDVSLSLSLYN